MAELNSSFEQLTQGSQNTLEMLTSILPDSIIKGMETLLLFSKILLVLFILYFLIKLVLKFKEFRNKIAEGNLYKAVNQIDSKLSKIVELLENNQKHSQESDKKEHKKIKK